MALTPKGRIIEFTENTITLAFVTTYADKMQADLDRIMTKSNNDAKSPGKVEDWELIVTFKYNADDVTFYNSGGSLYEESSEIGIGSEMVLVYEPHFGETEVEMNVDMMQVCRLCRKPQTTTEIEENDMALTPKGTVTGFSAIEKPSDTYGPATYMCKLAFTGEAAKKMKADIDALMAESMKTNKAKSNAKPPYKIEDKKLIVTFKRKAEITTKAGKHYEFDVKLFDTKGKPVEELLNIGEGTELIISYNPYLWNVASQGGAGVMMQMDMAQVCKLVKYVSTGGSSNPFGEVDGDYVAPKANPFEEVSEPLADDDGDGDF